MPALLFPAALLLAGAPALAGERDDAIAVSFALDDREARVLAAPALVLADGAMHPFADDGTAAGDVPGDGIWFLRTSVPRAESLHFGVRDGGRDLGDFDVLLPASGAAHFAFRTTGGEPPLVVDLKAPPAPATPAAAAVASAAPAGDESGGDTIAVTVFVDDRALGRLGASPRLRLPGQDPVPLRDDGTLEGDTAGDHVWVARATVQRAQYLRFAVLDGDDEVGELSAFLPSSSEAVLRVKTAEGEAGLEVVQEALPEGSVGGPATTGAAPNRLAHVLWVAIALFALAFGWVRGVAWRLWRDEVRPVLRRLDGYLDEVGAPPAPDDDRGD